MPLNNSLLTQTNPIGIKSLGRHAEKLKEELLTEIEEGVQSHHKKIVGEIYDVLGEISWVRAGILLRLLMIRFTV